jgi:hypothetical protein
MIRFSCSTCNHQLRAPAILAGKKGKCARCGAVNLVPEALSVDVNRAPGPSPFRSTADLEQGAIAGTMAMEEGRFLSAPGATALIDHPEKALEQVSRRLSDVMDAAVSGEPAEPAPVPVTRSGLGQRAMERISLPADSLLLPFDPPAADPKRAIVGALVIGLVLGFCIGLIASKWIL